MINYFQSAEKVLANRGTLERSLDNLRRRKARLIAAGAPSDVSSINLQKPYVSTSSANNALTDCLDLVEVMREIKSTEDTIAEIDEVIGQMEKDDGEILTAWYIKRNTKEEIAEALNYQSSTTVYDLKNRAVSKFAVLYYGAGALASI
jgi:DUF917 family protein